MMFFSNKAVKLMEDWHELIDINQLSDMKECSMHNKVLLFKHSTRCPVSAFALNRLQQGWDQIADKVDFFFLDLIKYRSISNQIAQDFGVQHQSPQLLLIDRGKSIFDCSHESVDVDVVLEQLHRSR